METSTHTTRTTIGWIATALAVIGALNWGLVGLFKFNLVAAIFGDSSPVARVIYVLVGLSGLYLIYFASALSREAHGGPGIVPGRPREAM